jgi:hypothetical protein
MEQLTARDALADLTPHALTVDEQSWARSSFSWALNADAVHINRCLSNLDDDALNEIVWCSTFLIGMVEGTLSKREQVARAMLAPDSLPERSTIAQQAINPDDLDVGDRVPLPIGVEGHAIVGGRTR